MSKNNVAQIKQGLVSKFKEQLDKQAISKRELQALMKTTDHTVSKLLSNSYMSTALDSIINAANVLDLKLSLTLE